MKLINHKFKSQGRTHLSALIWSIVYDKVSSEVSEFVFNQVQKHVTDKVYEVQILTRNQSLITTQNIICQ